MKDSNIFAPEHWQIVSNRLPDHMAAVMDQKLCPSCVRLRDYRPISSTK